MGFAGTMGTLIAHQGMRRRKQPDGVGSLDNIAPIGGGFFNPIDFGSLYGHHGAAGSAYAGGAYNPYLPGGGGGGFHAGGKFWGGGGGGGGANFFPPLTPNLFP
jgi:hypothetical protein